MRSRILIGLAAIFVFAVSAMALDKSYAQFGIDHTQDDIRYMQQLQDQLNSRVSEIASKARKARRNGNCDEYYKQLFALRDLRRENSGGNGMYIWSLIQDYTFNKLESEGCPKGSKPASTTIVIRDNINEYNQRLTQARTALRADDCIAFKARIVDLKTLAERILQRSNDAKAAGHYATAYGLVTLFERVTAEYKTLDKTPCPRPRYRISLFSNQPQTVTIIQPSGEVITVPLPDPCNTEDNQGAPTAGGTSLRYAPEDDREHRAWIKRLGRDLRAEVLPAKRRKVAQRRVSRSRLALPRKPATRCIRVSVNAGRDVLHIPSRHYLGFEPLGALAPTLGLFTPSTKATGTAFNMSMLIEPTRLFDPLRLKFGASTTWTWMKVNVFYMDSRISQWTDTIDPGAGNRLVVPGVDGIFTGVSVGGPGNEARNVSYSAHTQKRGGRIDAGQSWHTQISLTAAVYGAIGFSNTHFDEKFSGSILNVARDFSYVSSASVNQLKFRAGLALNKDFTLSNGLKFKLGGFAEIGPDYSWASGNDEFFFTGFDDTSVGLSARKFALGYAFGGSISYQTAGGMQLTAAVRNIRETGNAVFDRTGDHPTNLLIKAGNATIYAIGGTVPFPVP